MRLLNDTLGQGGTVTGQPAQCSYANVNRCRALLITY